MLKLELLKFGQGLLLLFNRATLIALTMFEVGLEMIITKMMINWYERQPKDVTNGSHVTTFWNFPIHTDRKMGANMPGILSMTLNQKPVC